MCAGGKPDLGFGKGLDFFCRTWDLRAQQVRSHPNPCVAVLCWKGMQDGTWAVVQPHKHLRCGNGEEVVCAAAPCAKFGAECVGQGLSCVPWGAVHVRRGASGLLLSFSVPHCAHLCSHTQARPWVAPSAPWPL